MRNIGKITLSVVIPTFNAGKWLVDCLNSVVEQDTTPCEIICINDGSTDNSLEIMQRYAKEFKIIKVFSTPNQGVSAARNLGIQEANGEYVYFLDSDDCLYNKRCLTLITQALAENRVDLLCFDGKSFFEPSVSREIRDAWQNVYHRSKAYGHYQNGFELLHALQNMGEYYSSACLAIYRTEFLRGNRIFFPVGMRFEDNLFSFKSFLTAKRVKHINETILHRRVRDGSFMQSKHTWGKVVDLFNIYKLMLAYLHDVDIPKEPQKTALSIVDSIRKEAIRRFNLLDDWEKNQENTADELMRFEMRVAGIKEYRNDSVQYLFPYKMFKPKERIIIYGAGRIGRQIYKQAIDDQMVNLIGIVDIDYTRIRKVFSPVQSIDFIKNNHFDSILIAIADINIVKQVIAALLSMGIIENKIKEYNDNNTFGDY